MLKRPIPSTGEPLPVIGLGTWQTFDVGSSARERAPLRAVLAELVSLGGALVDSSPMYGRAEEVVGDLSASLGLRDRLFVATKVWTSGREAGIAEMNASMKKMRADPIDLMQVHNLVDVGTHLPTLAAWKAEGRVRYIGITHYTASAHEEVARLLERVPLDVVQINYSVAERDVERRVLPVAMERGIATIINRPFATGALVSRLATRPLPPWAAEIGCATWTELLLKWILAHPAITCVIPATSSVEHVRSNMRAGQGELPDEAMRRRIVEAVA